MAAFYGKVVYRMINIGTGNECNAVCLRTDEGQLYILLRADEHPFVDSLLRYFSGVQVVCEGNLSGNLLLFDTISEHRFTEDRYC